MKQILNFLLTPAMVLMFALPTFAATSQPVGTVIDYLEGDIGALTYYAAIYDAGTTACNDATYNSYVATNQTGDAGGYSMGTATFAASADDAQLDQLSVLGVDDTHTFTTTAAITTGDCVIVYIDLDTNGLDTGDIKAYGTDVTEGGVGAGNDFDLTLTSGYLFQFQQP